MSPADPKQEVSTALKIGGATRVAAVIGDPVRHSLSPLIHNTWIAAAGLDAVYVPLSPARNRFAALIDSLRGGSITGLNVTLPFKEEALRLADYADAAARAAGAANVLLFHPEGTIEARNTDGIGLLSAFAEQAPHWRPADGPMVVLGAGGAARGAAAALLMAGAQVRIVNRTHPRAQALAELLPGLEAVEPARVAVAFAGASAIINATAAGLEGDGGLDLPLHALPRDAVVMDMVYKPLRTPLLRQASGLGLTIVDGLAMLIGQATPSFEAFFGCGPPSDVDVRGVALSSLAETEA